ncbi:hypothetical protein Q667_15750 [Marinobacter sp. C1S70]|nr:hypothetical protein Q667_15750 [Marinobacter sp. C1S70]
MAEAFVKMLSRDYLYLSDLLDAISVMACVSEWI